MRKISIISLILSIVVSTFAIANGNHSLIHWIRDFVRKQKCENNRNISKESEIFINFIKPTNDLIFCNFFISNTIKVSFVSFHTINHTLE